MGTKTPATVADRLAALQHERGLSDAEIAVKIHVSPRSVERWRTGRTVPTPAAAHALGRLFKVPRATFTEGRRAA